MNRSITRFENLPLFLRLRIISPANCNTSTPSLTYSIRYDKPADVNSMVVMLPLTTDNDGATLVEIKRWLERHGSLLGSAEARKIMEFPTFLDSNNGSRILTVSNSIGRICGNLGLGIANQAVRVLTDSE